MRDSQWVRNALMLLLAVAAMSASSPGKGDPENTEVWLEVPVRAAEAAVLTIAPEESQQISAVATSDLHPSETGYGNGYGKGSSHKGHKGYKGGYHDGEGYKGKKGYKAHKGYKKNHYGDYGKDHKAGHHDKGGKFYKGHDDKHKYYGDEHKGKKGKKGHHYGSKGHHNKGHKDKGFKNVYHKEEYHHHKKYYDDFDNQKYHNKYDDFDSYFDAHKGKDYKGGHYKREITQESNHTNIRSKPQHEESLIMSRVKAALEKLNENQTVTTIDVATDSLRYFGRVLLDTSRYRTRYEERDDYNDQCQTHDLKMIKKYLKNCNRFMRKYGTREDRTPPCVNEDIVKINKYLSICERSFTSRVSHRKRKQYNELMDLGNKLDMMTYPEVVTGENDENHYVTEDVCQVDDLKQMELYLKDCASGKGDDEDLGRPACDLPNYEKSLDYLTACESTFLSKASRGDRNEYNHLISVALTLIKKEVAQTERVEYEESDESQTSCTLDDLRESQNYIEECESLLRTESYQREYGSQMCRPKYMKKVHKFLLSCKHLLRNAPSKDQEKFSELLDTSARLSGKAGKKKTEKKTQIQVEDPIDEHPDCRILDLRAIPKYLRGCYKSKNCESETLLEVHEFLVMCEDSFLKYASPRDKKKYKDLVLMSDMLSTNEILQKQQRDRDDKEHMESICKIQILRKVPKYLKGCFQSGNCNSKQLLKVIKFLTLCEEFFSIAFSPKDRGKYKELKDMAEEVHNHAEEQRKSKTTEKKDHRLPDCTLSDLRKIPDYLKGCEKSQKCKRKQLLKVYKFLSYCEIPFTRSASRRDKRKYKKIIQISEKLSKNRQSTEHKCEVSQLRKLPKYLLKCSKFQNCNPKQLLEVKKYLRICQSAIFRRASKRDKRKYKELSTMAVVLTRYHHRRVPRRGVDRKKEVSHSQCQIKDLRKIPSYLKNCARKHNCKHKQLAKVKKFLVSCKGEFAKRASRKDKVMYKYLYMKSNALSKHPKKRSSHKQVRKDKQSYCQLKDLRKIPGYLKHCTKSRKCKHRQLHKVRNFLSTCQNKFVKKASIRDKRIYKRQISLSKELSKHRLIKRRHKQQRDSKLSFCKLRELRKIPRYLKSCSKSHICNRKQLLKVNRFLTSCKTVFSRKASRRDKKIYQRLSSSAEVLSRKLTKKRSYTMKRDTKHPYCKHRDLRKIPSYLKNCSKSHRCDRRQLLKINTFLTSCKKVFLRKASRRDKTMYQRLSSSAEALSKKCSRKRSHTGKRDTKLTYCKQRDLRKIPSYLKNCSKSHRCDRKQLLKVNTFLTSCKSFFLRKASRRDMKMYQRLSPSAEALSKHRLKKRIHERHRDTKLSYCKHKELRKVPSYLKNCSKSHRCARRQLLKVNSFLTTCKTVFLRKATRKEKEIYKKLSSSSAALSKHHSRKRSRTRKGDAKQSYCKLEDLRKIPSYLKNCSKGHRCKRRQLLIINKFLTSCKTVFSRKASRRDKRMFQRLSSSAELLSMKRSRKRSHTRIRDIKQTYCKQKDLTKIPSYLKNCSKSRRCDRRQLLKVNRFLTSCKTIFFRKASRSDKRMYYRLSSSAEALSKHRSTKRSHTRKRDAKLSYCKLRDLRKIPSYLKNCSKSGKCDRRQLMKVKNFLNSCKSTFTRKASRKDVKIYKRLFVMAEALIKHRPKRTPSKGKFIPRKKQAIRSPCQIKDLRKVPSYLKNCSKTHVCKQKQLMKVERFLTSCQTPFMRRASRKDSRVYKGLVRLSKRILSKDQDKRRGRRRRITSEKQVICQVKNLRLIQKHLGTCARKARQHRGGRRGICTSKPVTKMQKYLLSCQKIFLLKGTRRDKAEYKNLLILSEKLKKSSLTKDRKRDVKTRDIKRSVCQVRYLRKIPRYLKDCSTGVIIRGRKKIPCGKSILGKIRTFLSSCKAAFLKKASRKEKVKYRRLEFQAARIQSRRVKGKNIRRSRKSAAQKVARCKLQDLRKVKSYLKDCFSKGKRGARTRRQKKCNIRTLARVHKYLKSCQRTFLRMASRGDKKQYRYLSVLSVKLSKQISRGQDKVPPKKIYRYSCRKQDLRQLEKHYKFCKAKIRRATGRKSQHRRRRGSSRAQKRRRQEKLRRIRSRRQHRIYRSLPRRRSKRTIRIEHGRRRGRRWRARLKYRKGGKHHDKYGKNGHHEKGKYHDDHKGHKGHYAHEGQYGHKGHYGDQGGYGHHHHHGGYGHGFSRRYVDRGYGHDTHHGSHSNVKPVSTPAKHGSPHARVYPAPRSLQPVSGRTPVYVPAPSAVANAKTIPPSPAGFYPSPRLVVPPSAHVAPPAVLPAAASSILQTSASSGTNPGTPLHSFASPVKAFESFGDFGQFS